MLLTPEESLAALRAEGGALAAASAGRLGTPVPACPDWSVWDLVEHTGSVHRWAATVVEGGGRVRRRELPAGPPGDAVLDWFAEGLERLTGVLLASDPARRVWSFAVGSPSTVAWWVRRMAQETGMHRWDVEKACGGGGAVRGFDPRRAADGIDEYLFDFLPDTSDEDLAAATGPGGPGGPGGPRGSLHLHATDTDTGGEWVVDLATRTARREHAKSDTALRGPASDLLLWLWNRQPADGHLEVLGDPGVAERWTQVRI